MSYSNQPTCDSTNTGREPNMSLTATTHAYIKSDGRTRGFWIAPSTRAALPVAHNGQAVAMQLHALHGGHEGEAFSVPADLNWRNSETRLSSRKLETHQNSGQYIPKFKAGRTQEVGPCVQQQCKEKVSELSS